MLGGGAVSEGNVPGGLLRLSGSSGGSGSDGTGADFDARVARFPRAWLESHEGPWPWEREWWGGSGGGPAAEPGQRQHGQEGQLLAVPPPQPPPPLPLKQRGQRRSPGRAAKREHSA